MARKKIAKKAAKKTARKGPRKAAKKATPLGGTLGMVTLHVHDFRRAVMFYRDTMGLRAGDVIDTPDFGWAEFHVASNVILGLHADKKGLEEGARPPGGSSGFYFVVPNVDRAIERLRAKGAKVVDEPTDLSFGRVGAIEDPDGNVLSLLTLPRR